MINVDIKGLGVSLSTSLRQHAARRLDSAFNRIAARVERITLRIGDLNGPRGGRDKFCRVLVKLTGMDAVYVEDKCDDLYAAISHAVERASWASVRRIRHIKLKGKGHHQGRNFGLAGLEPG